MEELTLTTPALLFSAVSLILLAYTNRFLSYAQLVRTLRDRYMEDPSDINVAQIENLRKRLNLTRMMQVFGIASLFFCVVTMFLIHAHRSHINKVPLLPTGSKRNFHKQNNRSFITLSIHTGQSARS